MRGTRGALRMNNNLNAGEIPVGGGRKLAKFYFDQGRRPYRFRIRV